MNPRVNKIIFPMIDEIIEAFQADGIHIGMDEIFLLGSDKSPSTKGQDPGELFAKVVNEFHDHFSKQNKIQLYMWGDRLIDGKKYPYGEWESSMNGTATAIDKIPNDIILCDWHYDPKEAYLSIPMFMEKGFRVLPCSYINVEGAKALIKYSLRQQNPKMIGHVFTSWSSVPKDSLLLYPAFTEGVEIFKQNKIWDVAINTTGANADGTINVTLQSDKKDLVYFYTTDGKEPGKQSNKYTNPFKLDKTATIKAIAYLGDKPAGETTSRKFVIHQAVGKNITLKTPPSPKYTPVGGAAALVNGIASTLSYSDGQWAGFEGQEIEAVINLGAEKEVSEVSFHTFNAPASWIYPALLAEVWTSSDGVNFKKAGETTVDQSSKALDVLATLSVKQKAAFIKLVIPKRLIPLDAKAGAGSPAWIFIDEIIVK
jgi:hypothetical protein